MMLKSESFLPSLRFNLCIRCRCLKNREMTRKKTLIASGALKRSKNFRQMIRRSRRLERRAEADLDPLATPSLEVPEKDASSPDMSLDSSQHCGSGILDPAQRVLGQESSSSPGNLLANLQIPTITFSVDRQPPAEVRTGYTLPAIVVNLKRSQVQTNNSRMTLDDSSLWGQASLVCADGRVAMAQFRANILTSGSLVAPLFRSPSYGRRQSLVPHFQWARDM